jgi:NADH-quinone oxidoreductase subunit E
MLGILKALRTTVGHLPRKPLTVQYPEVREELPERSRGLFKVVVDVTTEEARCRACTLCETNCPVQVIRVDYRDKYDLPAVDQAALTRDRLAEQGAVDLSSLGPIIDGHLESGTGLNAVLQRVQDAYGYLPRAALQQLSLETGTSLSQIYGTASFSDRFRLAPPAAHIISVCRGTTCYAAGAPLVAQALREALGIDADGTTADGFVTLQSVDCLGVCGPAPVVRVDDRVHVAMTPERAHALVHELRVAERVT